MAFVKLDCGILNSTLWVERDCREVFITALLMALPHEILEPMPQIEVRSLELTGFVVPPGWYGFVPAAGVGIIRYAMVERESGMDALEKLGAPDSESRSKDFDGRRLVRVDGGYLILNFIRYRDKDATAADRQKRWRERQRLKESALRVTPLPSRVTSNQAEAEAEAEADSKKDHSVANAPPMPSKRGTRLPDDWKLTDELRGFASDLGLDPDGLRDEFVDYWTAVPGSKGLKLDWDKTFKNRCRELGKKPRSQTARDAAIEIAIANSKRPLQ